MSSAAATAAAALRGASPASATGHVCDTARKSSGSSFLLPMRALPEPRRKAMLTLYAFCRELDDCVDAGGDDGEQEKLDFWRAEIAHLYSGQALSHPLASALAEPVERYRLKRRYFDDMLDGFEMDREGRMFKPSLSDLEQYCYRVAGCVGLLSTQIFGCRREESRKFAVALGNALQLTNILRDIEADGRLGRIYLPAELLARHGLEAAADAAELAARPEALDALCRDLAAKAASYFGMAGAYVTREDAARLLPALLMRDIYGDYLRQMLERGWPWRSGHRPALGWGAKAGLLWKLARHRAASR